MPDEPTEAWLWPMYEEMLKRPDGKIKLAELSMDCMIPITEVAAQVDNPMVNFLATTDREMAEKFGDGRRPGSAVIDWIRIGERLREELEWWSYPSAPDYLTEGPDPNSRNA